MNLSEHAGDVFCGLLEIVTISRAFNYPIKNLRQIFCRGSTYANSSVDFHGSQKLIL